MSNQAGTFLRRLAGGPLKDLSEQFWWLWASTLVNRIANFVVPFCVLYLTTARSMSDATAGFLISLYGLGGIAGSLLGGVAVDRYGAKRLLVLGSIGGAFATFGLGVSSGFMALGGILLVTGVFSGAIRPATNALVTEIVPPGSQVRVFALNYWAMNLGFAIACLCAGFATEAGYTTLFFIDGASTLMCGLMVLFLVRNPHTPRGLTVSAARGRRSPRARVTLVPYPMRDRLFAAVVVMSVLTTAMLQQLTATLPLAMRTAGHSPASYGIVAAFNGLLVCLLQMPVSTLTERRPLVRSLALGALLMGIGFGLTAIVTGVSGFMFTVLIWTMGEIVLAPATPALTAQLAPAGSQGAYQGVLNAAWNTGAIVGPILGTAAFAAWGGSTMWLVCGLVGVLVGIGYGALRQPLTARLSGFDGRRPITSPDPVQVVEVGHASAARTSP